MSDPMVFMCGAGSAGERISFTSDSLNQRVRDNEIEVAARKPIPTEALIK